jgi:excisionase family DNA binding protein
MSAMEEDCILSTYEPHSLSTLRVEKDYYTTKQLAEIYHVSTQTVSHWIRKGWLEAHKVGEGRGRWRVHPQQLEDIEARKDELIELSKKYWVRLLVKMR